MKCPMRIEYDTGAEHLEALKHWSKTVDLMEAQLLGFLKATRRSNVRPRWLDKAICVRSVQSISDPPPRDENEHIRIRLKALAGNLVHYDLEPVRLCHGEYDWDATTGQKLDCIFVECKKAA